MASTFSKKLPVSGIILAGGQSERFPKGNKLVVPLAGIPCIRRTIRALYRFCQEVVVVTPRPQDFSETGPLFVNDSAGPKGTVRAVIAGLQAARFDWSLVVGADMPFPSASLVFRQYASTAGVSAVWLEHARGWPVPFHGLLHKQSIEALRDDMCEGFPALDGFTFERLRHRLRIAVIPHTEIQRDDPSLNCFFDIDTEDDMLEAEQWLGKIDLTRQGAVIGIDGPPGAGKTTLIRALLEQRSNIAALRPFSRGNDLDAYRDNLLRHAAGVRGLLLDRTLLSSVCRDVYDLKLFSQTAYDTLLEPLWPTACHYVVLMPELETLLGRRSEKFFLAELQQRRENMQRAVAYYTAHGVPITVCRNQAEAWPVIETFCQ